MPQPLPVALHWVRGEGAVSCIDGSQLSQRLDDRLGHRVFSAPSDAELAVEGVISRTPEGAYRANLTLVSHDGTVVGSRALQSDAATCDELSETVSVVLAVMLNPDAEAVPSEPQPEAPAAAPPAPVEESSDTPPPSPSQPPPVAPPAEATPAPPRDALGVLARLVTHTLPQPVVGLGLDYARDLPRRVRLRVEALAFMPGASTREVEGVRRGADLQLLTLGAAACPSLLEGRGFGLSLCGGLQGGVLLYRSTDPSQPEEGALGLLQVSAGARLWWQNERLRVSVGSAAVAALMRHDLVIEVAGAEDVSILDQPTFSADVDAALAVRF